MTRTATASEREYRDTALELWNTPGGWGTVPGYRTSIAHDSIFITLWAFYRHGTNGVGVVRPSRGHSYRVQIGAVEHVVRVSDYDDHRNGVQIVG